MFPRYNFFRPSKAAQSIESVRSTKGVFHIVRFGFEQGLVSDHIVAIIKAFEAAQNQASLADISNLRAGQQVKLKHVALGNMEGLLQSVSSKRFAVLLEILGRSTLVQLDHHQLEIIH